MLKPQGIDLHSLVEFLENSLAFEERVGRRPPNNLMKVDGRIQQAMNNGWRTLPYYRW